MGAMKGLSQIVASSGMEIWCLRMLRCFLDSSYSRVNLSVLSLKLYQASLPFSLSIYQFHIP